MAVENFLTGTLIIPMDVQFQNNGMFLAYGLVYSLLEKGIKVKWGISPGKVYGGTDFTATTINFKTLVPVGTKAYSGGPFIIDSTSASQAAVIIAAWQVLHPTVEVHEAISGFTAQVAATMNKAPRIAIEEINAKIIIDYLNVAGIPDSRGLPWDENNSPGVLSSSQIGAGAFFGYNETDPCKFLVYDIFLSPHTSQSNWANPINLAELDRFLRIGGHLHATCRSISAIENIVGPFLTTAGIPSFQNKGDKGSFVVDAPDFPTTQAVSTPGVLQELPGGSEQTWRHSDVTYNPFTQVLAHFTNNGIQYDFMAVGPYKGGTGAGKIVYEGGHQYKINLPYSSNADGPYVRFLLDSLFFAVSKPYIRLRISPRGVPSGSPSIVTFIVENPGGSNAENLSLTIRLKPWAIYNNDANITPTSISIGGGGEKVLSWSVASLVGNTGPGTIITFTGSVTPPSVGILEAANYSAVYDDDFNEEYDVKYCASLESRAGASPNIKELPLVQHVGPNDVFNWSIISSNNGSLILNNTKVVKVIPAELIYVSATPSPSTVIVGGAGETTLTWISPSISSDLNIGGILTISINVKAPPATTKSYDNTATLTGTDTTPANYSVSTTASVYVVNTAPTVTIIYPNGGEIICSQAIITWTAQDPDGDPLSYTVQYSNDGGANYTTIVEGISNTSYTWNVGALPSGDNYSVRVIATDGELTGSDTSNGSFTIDTTPPTVSWVNPVNGALINNSIEMLSVQATDNLGVASVAFQYSQDEINFIAIGLSNIGIGDIYSINWDTSGLTQGNYILRAIAEDTCGRTSSTDINVLFVVPPKVEITNPNGGEIICPSGTTITWIGSSIDGSPLVYNLLYSNNNGATFNTIITGLTTNSYFWDTAGLPSGDEYIIKVIASDGFSLSEDVSTGPFTINTSPPVISWIAPSNGQYIRSTVSLIVKATDNILVSGVTFSYSNDGGITYIDIGTVTANIGGDEYVLPFDTSLLDNGLYILRAVALNNCNLSSEADRNVIIDNSPPIVKIISPINGSTVEGIVPIIVSASDNECLSEVKLYIDGILVDTKTLNGKKILDFVFVWDTHKYSEGDHNVEAVATDCGGLTSKTTSTFIVDNLPECYTQILINKVLKVPREKPYIEDVLEVNLKNTLLDVTRIKAINGTKFSVSGYVEVQVTYVANLPEQPVHFFHANIPFTGFMVCKNIAADACVEVIILNEYTEYNKIDEGAIELYTVLFLGTKEV